MNVLPPAGSVAVANAVAALGGCPIATDDTILLQQAVILAANLITP